MKQRNPGVFRASCLYFFSGVGIWLVWLFVNLFAERLSGVNPFVLDLQVSILCYLPFIIVPVITVNKRVPGMLRLNPISVGNALRICAIAFLTVFAVQNGITLWYGILQKLGLNPFALSDLLPSNRAELMIELFSVAILAPLSEEILFRGAMLSAWEPRGGKKAVWVTAILFAILHGNLAGFPAHLLAGVLLAQLVLFTDSLYAGLIFHTVYNAVLTILSYVSSAATSVDTAQDVFYQNILASLGSQGVITLVLDIILTGLLIYAIMRQMRNRASMIQVLREMDDSNGPVYIDGMELMQKSKRHSPFCAAVDRTPLRTSTILVLMASVSSAAVRFIVNILSMISA